MPPTAKEYEEAGLPWFDYYSDGKALQGSKRLAGLDSVATLGKKKGDVPLPENEPVVPEQVMLSRAGTMAPVSEHEVRSDFAAEMVDPTADATLPTLDVVEPPQAEATVEEPAATVSDEPEGEPLISSPVLLSRPNPRYPAAAMRLRKQAEVSLRILIGTNGKVVDVERVGPDPGMGFSKAAINAALATQWRPATRDGEPIEMWTEMRIAFKP